MQAPNLFWDKPCHKLRRERFGSSHFQHSDNDDDSILFLRRSVYSIFPRLIKKVREDLELLCEGELR